MLYSSKYIHHIVVLTEIYCRFTIIDYTTLSFLLLKCVYIFIFISSILGIYYNRHNYMFRLLILAILRLYMDLLSSYMACVGKGLSCMGLRFICVGGCMIWNIIISYPTVNFSYVYNGVHYISIHTLYMVGTAVAQWLRCCATNQKVAGSIPAGVSGFFIDIKLFRSHYGPGVDSASNTNEYQEYLLGG